jgi:hypothetical protein
MSHARIDPKNQPLQPNISPRSFRRNCLPANRFAQNRPNYSPRSQVFGSNGELFASFDYPARGRNALSHNQFRRNDDSHCP